MFDGSVSPVSNRVSNPSRGRSSARQSACFASRKSWVQVPSSPPSEPNNREPIGLSSLSTLCGRALERATKASERRFSGLTKTRVGPAQLLSGRNVEGWHRNRRSTDLNMPSDKPIHTQAHTYVLLYLPELADPEVFGSFPTPQKDQCPPTNLSGGRDPDRPVTLRFSHYRRDHRL